jgi:acyl-CoA thioesterase YciA
MDEEKELVLKVMPMPSDTNLHGDIFGGWIMSQVDIAGAILASQLSIGRVSTVAVNNFVFKQPIYVGDLVSFYAKIIKIGNTSVTVDVEVWAQRKRYENTIKVTEATLTYVALDDNGKPRPVQSK